MKAFVKIVLGLLVALMLFAYCASSTPKGQPNINTVVLQDQTPEGRAAANTALALVSGMWEIKDLGVFKIATFDRPDVTVRLIGMPNGRWYAF